MITCGGVRKWFSLPERLVIFTFGLLFSKGMMIHVLANFMTFLTNTWNLKLKEAAAIVNFQEGLRDMLQIHVALCIDAWLGYRRMLILSSVLYCAGLCLLSLSFSLLQTQEVHPMENVDYFKKLKHTPFWEGLALLIVGEAAQVIPLSSLSFDQTKFVKVREHCELRGKIGRILSKVKIGGWRQLQRRFIRLLCTAVQMLGTITFVYGFISFERGWQLYFAVSAGGIAVGLLWFLCGLPFYGLPRLQPNPLSTMLRVLIAAVRKRHLIYRENLYGLHRCDGDDQNQLLTDHLECLNNAAVKESSADDNSIMEETRWKLCTVKEVEQTKLLLNIVPMSVTFIVYGMVKSLGNTFFIEQANSMRGGNGILIVVFQMIQGFSKSPIKRGYEVVFEKRIDRIKRGYSDAVKIGLGMLASIICCAVATSVESKRLKALPPSLEGLPNDPNAIAHISALWLVPQFLFLAAMEGLAGDGIQDFYGHYAPDSRRYGPVFTSLLTGLGAVLSVGFIAILDYYSKSRYNESWLGDSINQSRLDSIYHAYVIVALVNCFLYAYVAKQYSYDNITGREEEEEEEIQFLEVKEETAAGDEQNNQ
ncbi:protein NRT1/ PTR FAMILY 5.5-like [Durio zibethinus]|uniref:Protein NRT1/ PTR FAMILY 5.5-like n=1 Tax=Durio zibethinus TaxID=66656 RepID=A0A6P5Y4R4_DURZI|nr:protein NRT1/ PTR FAMILY 5.5-like [Durio zibethinus]XP_022735406.1 protein NRT1/ PTR FAMILY 5.5-like [Durio zibethinus]